MRWMAVLRIAGIVGRTVGRTVGRLILQLLLCRFLLVSQDPCRLRIHDGWRRACDPAITSSGVRVPSAFSVAPLLAGAFGNFPGVFGCFPAPGWPLGPKRIGRETPTAPT